MARIERTSAEVYELVGDPRAVSAMDPTTLRDIQKEVLRQYKPGDDCTKVEYEDDPRVKAGIRIRPDSPLITH